MGFLAVEAEGLDVAAGSVSLPEAVVVVWEADLIFWMRWMIALAVQYTRGSVGCWGGGVGGGEEVECAGAER